MSYLKNNTHYSKALTDVSEREIHRGRLEALLRQNLFYEFDSLCRYDSSVSSGLSSYIISTLEVEQIIRFLILLSSNSTDKFIYQFPGYISKHTEIDVNKLANAKNYEEFLNAHSPPNSTIFSSNFLQMRKIDFQYRTLRTSCITWCSEN